MDIMFVIPYGLMQVSKVPSLFFFLVTEYTMLHPTYNTLLGWWILVA